jgi:hypothetical protein
MSAEFKVGDSVVVNRGVKDPDLGGDLENWQGRVTDIQKYEQADALSVEIAWDSITLRNIPESVIVHCEREGLDWATMGLYMHEVTLAKARDTIQDTAKTKAELAEQYGWIAIGNDEEQGRRIQAIVNSADKNPPHRHHEFAILEAWDRHLRMTLTLPFAAEVAEFQERGPLRGGDKATVVSFSEVDDLYGVLVAVQHRRKSYHFPLCDLEASDLNSPNHDSIEDYRVWFANR